MKISTDGLVVAILCALLASACAHTKLQALTVDEMIRSNLEEGHVVSVKGYLRFGDDSRNLWSNKDAYELVESRYTPQDDPAWNHCITLYGIEDWRKELLAKDRSYVVIAGVIHRYPSKEGDVSVGSCSDLGISIRLIGSD